jgi:fructose-1,6-bisphosphatase-3
MVNEKYLRLLANEYHTTLDAMGEIIHLEALQSLPKGTEYFFSDLHGEDKTFIHLVRSASGNIRTKITELFESTLSSDEQNQLANLVYDPDRILAIWRDSGRATPEWLRITIFRLVDLCKYIATKYSRRNVMRKTPKEFSESITELLTANYEDPNRRQFINGIIANVIETRAAFPFIRALCIMIQEICVNTLHIIGDIFDRGPGPHKIMEELMTFPDVDFQWGNHDILWMGAACGNEVCMAAVLRIGISYNTFDALEDGYNINLRPLSSFAATVYADDPCDAFQPKLLDENEYDLVSSDLAAKMHKAIAVIQFKLEGQMLKNRPEFSMDDRIVLEKVDFEKGVYIHNGKEYPMKDMHFPTIDPSDPLELSKEEEELMVSIRASFRHSEVLHRHVRFLYANGSTYKIRNNNLLFHGCIPMNEDGTFQSMTLDGEPYSGRALMDRLNEIIQDAYFRPRYSLERTWASDFMWYLWCGAKSPLFGKSQMSTFENYFLSDKDVRKEHYNPYYQVSQNEATCRTILAEFGLDPDVSRIINGHVPVKIKDGETPVKAGGKLYVIDGGIAKAYQSKTGIAGYTLIFNSHHLALAEHKNFEGITSEMGSYTPKIMIIELMPERLMVKDTDLGKQNDEKIADLKNLLAAFRKGTIKERTTAEDMVY